MVSSPDQRCALRLRVLDTDLLIHCDQAAATTLRHLYAPFAPPPTTPADAPLPPAAVRDVEPGDVVAAVAEINALALAGVDRFAVHAGAVAHGGAVVAFPAASGAGKSTLTAACLQAGLAYVSDEALCLSWHDASVHPYPRPLALSPWSATALGLDVGAGPELLVSPADLGATVADPPLALTHLVLLDPPGGAPGLRPAPRSAGVAELLRRSFTHWHHPERAFELAHQVMADAAVWRLSPSSPAADATTIATLLP